MAASLIRSILRRAATALRSRSRVRRLLMILGDLEAGSARAQCIRLGDGSVVLCRATTQRGALVGDELFRAGSVAALRGAGAVRGRTDSGSTRSAARRQPVGAEAYDTITTVLTKRLGAVHEQRGVAHSVGVDNDRVQEMDR